MSTWKNTEDFFDLLDGIEGNPSADNTNRNRNTRAVPRQERSTFVTSTTGAVPRQERNTFVTSSTGAVPRQERNAFVTSNIGTVTRQEKNIFVASNIGAVPRRKRSTFVSSRNNEPTGEGIKMPKNKHRNDFPSQLLDGTVKKINISTTGKGRKKYNESMHGEKNISAVPKQNWSPKSSVYGSSSGKKGTEQIPAEVKSDNRNYDRSENSFKDDQNCNSLFKVLQNENLNQFRYLEFNNERQAFKNQVQKGKHNTFGYVRLRELSEKKSNDIIVVIADPKSRFVYLFEEELRPDFILLVMKILHKVCDTEFSQIKTSILSSASNPLFLEQVTNYVGTLPMEENKERKQKIVSFLPDVLIFLDNLIDLLPTTAYERLKKLIVSIGICIKNIEKYQNIVLSQQIFHDLENVSVKYFALEAKKKEEDIKGKQGGNDSKLSKPPDNFRNISIIPTFKDLFTPSKDIYLRQNIVEGSYENIDHYLDVQFRLLREDFVGPLREGIHEYMKNLQGKQRINNIKIYPNARFMQGVRNKNRCGYEILFDCDGRFKRVNWEFSKRFMYGSLLLFTKDNFKNFFFATVSERNLYKLKDGLITVEITHGTDLPMNLFEEVYLMVESEVYFEPYFHVLFALQNIDPETFPMEKYIVHVDSENYLPKYFEQTNYNWNIFNYKVDVLNENSWPSSDKLSLDQSQYIAFKAALTNEFVAIQGPPGTGKTHIGLLIAKVLLKNVEKISNFGPLLVICYTNHALDQFLEGLLSYTKNLIRIGGQSRSDILKEFNLTEVRKRTEKNDTVDISRSCKNLHFMMRKYLEDISKNEHLIKEVLMFRGILKVDVIEKYMTPNQREMLLEPNFFDNWLTEEAFYVDERTTNTTPSFDENLEFTEIPEEYNSNKFISEDSTAETMPFVDNTLSSNNPNMEQMEDGSGEESEDDEEHYQRLANLIIGIDDIEYLQTTDNIINSLLYITNLKELKIELLSQKDKLNTLMTLALSPEVPLYERPTQPAIQFEYETLRELSSYYRYVNMRLKKIRNMNIAGLQNILNDDVWQLNYNKRWNLYRWWVEQYTISLKNEIQELEMKYRDTRLQYDELRQLEDLLFVCKADVVGVTTTGAARIRSLLNKLKAKVVIVEEAAEVLEAHIVTSMTKDCQHVILIGDHKQLRPSTAVFKLATQYKMDISLFERMLRNGLGCYMLGVQHRMRPEIASLIVPAIYKELANHPSVLNRPNIKGVTNNLFFLTHTEHEDEVPDSASRRNRYEADFMMALCRHLLLQGYLPNEITILATYSGQMQYMIKERRKNAQLREVRIIVVDKFQGEENRIILLSLVRSNKLGKIGFLSIKNRVCVALSRAKEGLYIIGNMSNLEDSEIWYDIKGQLEKGNHIGPDLTLRCEVHQNHLTRVRKASDFLKSPEGGCDSICDKELVCGHKCTSVCHIIDREHLNYKCKQPCERKICSLEGHDCPKECYKECDVCKKLVKKDLPCGHSADLQCYKNPEDEKCFVMVDAVLPACGHAVSKLCYIDVNNVHCSHACEDRLPCGHQCEMRCHKLKDPDHLEYKCMKDCTRNDLICTNDHKCKKRCYEDCGKCITKVKKKLTCGHTHDARCSDDESSIICTRKCKRKLDCNHDCKRKCFEVCGGCKEQVVKVLPDCKHLQTTLCSDEPNPKKCSQPCNRTLVCGHPCKRKCNQVCCNEKCLEMIETPIRSPCGHDVTNYQCYLTDNPEELPLLCKSLCNAILPCGHKCEGDCSRCVVVSSRTIHAPCIQKCEKRLVCGHICSALCREICPPCNQKCLNECEHRSCSKRCGEFCDPCNKACTRRCPHYVCDNKCSEICEVGQCNESCTKYFSCGHKCTGLCGEQCPSCAICLTEYYDNTRYLQLEDCKCKVDVREVDLLFYNEEFGEKKPRNRINIKCCPRCQKPIIKTMRYKSAALKTFRDIGHIKRKVNSQFDIITKSSKQLLKDIEESLYVMRIDGFELFRNFVTCLRQTLKNTNYGKKQPTKYYAVIIIAELFSKAMKSRKSLSLHNLARIFEQRLEYINQDDIIELTEAFKLLDIEVSDSFLRNTTFDDKVWKHCKKCKFVISSWSNLNLECYNCDKREENINIDVQNARLMEAAVHYNKRPQGTWRGRKRFRY